MANNTKTNPVGIDVPLQALQTILYTALNQLWSIELEAYGRVYINENDGVMIPEAFIAPEEGQLQKADYSGTLLTADVSKFFFIDYNGKPLGNTMRQTKVDVCFIINLGDIYPNILHRADAEVHRDVEKLLKDASALRVTDVDGPITGIKNVFKGLDFKYTDDMQPKHVFKFTINLIYGLDQSQQC